MDGRPVVSSYRPRNDSKKKKKVGVFKMVIRH